MFIHTLYAMVCSSMLYCDFVFEKTVNRIYAYEKLLQFVPLFPPPPNKNMFAGTRWKGVPGYLQLLTPHDYRTVAGVDTDWKRLVGLQIWYFAYLLHFSPHYILYAVDVCALSMVLIVTFTSLIWMNICWKQSWLLGHNFNSLESCTSLWIQNSQQHYFQFSINGPM
jgi:hypothetical protein